MKVYPITYTRMRIISMAIAFGFATVFSALVISSLVDSSFNQNQAVLIKQNLHIGSKFVEQMEFQLEKSVHLVVFSSREFLNYIKNPNELAANMSLSQDEVFAIDHVVLFGPDYKPMIGVRRAGSSIVTWPRDEIHLFSNDDSFLDFKTRGGTRSGFVVLNGKVHIVAAKQILSPDKSKILGSIAITTPWNSNLVRQIQHTLDVDVQVTEVVSEEKRVEIRDTLSKMRGSTNWLLDISNDASKGHILFYDTLENPVLLLTLLLPRTTGESFQSLSRNMTMVAVMTLLLLGLFAVMSFHKVNKESARVLNVSNEMEARFNGLLETIPGYVSWLDKDYKYIGVSRKLADALGREPEDFLGRKVGSILRDDTRQFLEKVIEGTKYDHTSAPFKHHLPTSQGLRQVITVVRKSSASRETIIFGIDIADMADDMFHKRPEQEDKAA